MGDRAITKLKNENQKLKDRIKQLQDVNYNTKSNKIRRMGISIDNYKETIKNLEQEIKELKIEVQTYESEKDDFFKFQPVTINGTTIHSDKNELKLNFNCKCGEKGEYIVSFKNRDEK